MDVLLHNVALDLATCDGIERNLRGRSGSKAGPRRDAPTRDLREVVQECVQACRKSRKRHHEENGPGPDLSDAALSQYTRFTDHNALHVYRQFLWYTPRLVNVVIKCHAPHSPTLHQPCACTHTCTPQSDSSSSSYLSRHLA